MTDTTATTPGDEDGASRNSILGRIKARREAIVSTQYTDLPVPRWEDPVIVVRYGTLDHSVIRHGFRVVEKAKDKAAAEVAQNTDLLIKACIGIYALDGDKQVSLSNEGPDAEWTRFDDDLAEAMGLDMSSNPTARQALRTIYFTDGDVFSHAQAVIKFSGYNTEETDQSLLGE